MNAVRPRPAFAFSHPAHIVAFGFGAGLSPVAPGTAGTLLAWAIAWGLSPFLAPAALFALGVGAFLVDI